mmetsp:Transcript_54868/g.124896  ORF Transcript_54868/g.124896 Transcript_54868/m.124896 type:complete len:283 (+) Transcript_54868:1-849(+)
MVGERWGKAARRVDALPKPLIQALARAARAALGETQKADEAPEGGSGVWGGGGGADCKELLGLLESETLAACGQPVRYKPDKKREKQDQAEAKRQLTRNLLLAAQAPRHPKAVSPKSVGSSALEAGAAAEEAEALSVLCAACLACLLSRRGVVAPLGQGGLAGVQPLVAFLRKDCKPETHKALARLYLALALLKHRRESSHLAGRRLAGSAPREHPGTEAGAEGAAILASLQDQGLLRGFGFVLGSELAAELLAFSSSPDADLGAYVAKVRAIGMAKDPCSA